MKQVCIELMNTQKMIINLYDEYAPITVGNFLHLVKNHFYDGMVFHRVIKGFVCQAGCFKFNEETRLLDRATVSYTIPGEFVENGFENAILHTAGVISMARTDDPNSASTQFFICAEDCPTLDYKYAAFGIIDDEASFNVLQGLNNLVTGNMGPECEDFPISGVSDFCIKTITEIPVKKKTTRKKKSE